MDYIDEIERRYKNAAALRMARDEQIIRSLLELWVSELEPAVARGPDGEIIGLCDSKALLGTKPFILRVE